MPSPAHLNAAKPCQRVGTAVLGSANQNRLAATLMVKARMAVLKTNYNIECSSTQRRSERVLTVTSAVCKATAMVKAK